MDTNEHLDELKRIEETISEGEDTALIARWQSGKYLNTLKQGKQLPRGVLEQASAELNVGRSELNARMKFATKYPSRGELTDAIGKFGSWFRIVRDGLTDKRRHSQCHGNRKLEKAKALVEKLDPAEFTDVDLKMLDELEALIMRHQRSVKTLGVGVAA